MTRAVVLGGGFAGVLAAAALADRVATLDEVLLVEGDAWPVGPAPRRGVPQGRHSHVLVGGGAEALEALLPGVTDDLAAAGALRRDLPGGALIRTAEGWFHRRDTGSYLVSCSRWLLDHVVRARATTARDRLAVRQRTRAVGLVGTARRVTGVLLRGPDGATAPYAADLVVDATGRRSRTPRWLAELGAAPVAEETVDPGLAYATRVLAAPPGLTTDMPAVMIHPQAVDGREGHGATLSPIEDGRWVVTLTGSRADPPPLSDDGFAACAWGLPTSLVAELMGAAKPLGPVRPYLATVNRRRYFERGPLPEGLLVLGDALVAVNPVHSHGLTVAARGAARLADALRHRGVAPAVTAGVQAALAQEAERSWHLATVAHRGAGPAGTARPPSPQATRMGERLRRALLVDPDLAATFFRDQTLVPGPAPDARAVGRALVREPAPPLTERAAIAQYPLLSAWWGGTRDD